MIAAIGKTATGIRNILPELISITAKPPNTFKSVWPASIFAKSLTDKLIGLMQYEINSITKRSGWRINGVPEGKNNDKNPNPCL